MGVDKVGHRAAMPGVEYFLCCMMAQAGDIKGQSTIARRKYTDKNSNIRCARGGISLPAGGYFYLIWLGGEEYEGNRINKPSYNRGMIIWSVNVLSLRIPHSWQAKITTQKLIANPME